MLSTMGGQTVPHMAEGVALLQTIGRGRGRGCGEHRIIIYLCVQSMSTCKGGSCDGIVMSHTCNVWHEYVYLIGWQQCTMSLLRCSNIVCIACCWRLHNVQQA